MELKSFLKKAGVLRIAESIPAFILTSGELSPYIIDLRGLSAFFVEKDSVMISGLELITKLFHEKLRDLSMINQDFKIHDLELIVSSAEAGVPWGSSLATKLRDEGMSVGFAYLSSKVKTRWGQKQKELYGDVYRKNVLFIDDLFTNFTTGREVIKRLRDEGARVMPYALCIVNRKQYDSRLEGNLRIKIESLMDADELINSEANQLVNLYHKYPKAYAIEVLKKNKDYFRGLEPETLSLIRKYYTNQGMSEVAKFV